MDEIFKKLLHLGVGIVKTVQDGFQVTSTDPQGMLFEMISKGEAADDENIQRLRSYIDNITGLANDYESKSKEIFESLYASLQNVDANNLITDLNQKFNDIVGKIKGGSGTQI